MKLHKNDYVDVGAGSLYGHPFLSRWLIYRLFDCNQSVLIYYRDESDVSTRSDRDASITSVTIKPPTVAYAHFCLDSATIDRQSLLLLPPVEIDLATDQAVTATSGNLAVSIEKFHLPLTEKMICVYESKPQRVLQIEESNYQVKGPIDIQYWPEETRVAKLRMRCFKVSVLNLNQGLACGIDSPLDWRLDALDLDFDGNIEVILSKAVMASDQECR